MYTKAKNLIKHTLNKEKVTITKEIESAIEQFSQECKNLSYIENVQIRMPDDKKSMKKYKKGLDTGCSGYLTKKYQIAHKKYIHTQCNFNF